MKSDMPLDYAIFQLSPKRSRCELFVSSDGNTEKLASGLVKPFVKHLKVAKEQVGLSFPSIKLEVERSKNAETWFTKGTLERFVRFVSTPEVLELVNTLDAEMSQVEADRRIYSQGSGDQLPSLSGGVGTGSMAAADATKKELLRAIDVRLVAVRQDLSTACAHAAGGGFNSDTVSELQMFADQFGAHRLSEACNKFRSLCERRADLINPWKLGVRDQAIRSSYGLNMSIEEDPATQDHCYSGFHQSQHLHENKHPTIGREPDATEQQPRHHHLEQFKPSTCQQSKPSSIAFPLRHARESSVEKADSSSRECHAAIEKEKKEGSDQTESSQNGQPTRRLSVQDRINLFENKQKENSVSGRKSAVGKFVELHRLSSDVSSTPAVTEMAVLRRWSGANDMSIDLSGEKKETKSSLCTPLSSSVSQTKSEDQKGLHDTATSANSEIKIVLARAGDGGVKDHADSQARVGVTSSREEVVRTKVGTNSGIQLMVSSGRSEDASESNNITSTSLTVENDGSKDQPRNKIQSSSFLGRAGDNSLKDQANSQTQFRSLPGARAQQLGSADQGKFKSSFGSDKHGEFKEHATSETQVAVLKDLLSPRAQFEAFASRAGDNRSASESSHSPRLECQNRVEDVESRDQLVSQSCLRVPVRTAMDSVQLEGGTGSKIWEAFVHDRRADSDLLASLPMWRLLGEVEEVGKEDLSLSEKQCGSSATNVEDSGLPRMKFKKQFSASERMKSQGRRDESSSVCGNNRTISSDKMASEDQEAFGSILTVPAEQVQRVRQSKGNQELNDELKMKANELEKLFAEHKLRVPGNQSDSTRRNKPVDIQTVQAGRVPYRKPVAKVAPAQLPDYHMLTASSCSSSNVTKFNASLLMEVVGNHDYSNALNQNFSELCFSDDSRGKLYDKYMQKRDAKLREEWGTNRDEKEAKLKNMQDSLERSRAEMRAKLSGSAYRQDLVLSARRRAERLRSFNARSTMKREERQLDFVDSEDVEDIFAFPEEKSFGQDRSFSETFFGDGVSRSTQRKKLQPNKNLSSSTPRTSAAPVPRSAVRASNSSLGRRRIQSENPLVQSVPNLSDLRKENTKPSFEPSKTASRPQLRNYARSIEDIPLVKDEKPHRSQSLRKSSASSVEIRDMDSVGSQGVVLTPLKFDKEQSEQTLHEKFSKHVELKPFLRKGNYTSPGAGAGISKLKASMENVCMINEEDSDEFTFGPEDPADVVKDEEDEEFENESENLMNSGLDNGDALRSFSQVDPSLVAELPLTVPSTFHPIEYVQGSPGESPVSWNTRIHLPLSFPHEASDIDASADSPMGSPAFWNSHSLNQAEVDEARMRKKWASAQKPILVANSSHYLSRKDVTKGFKRLLKFGRKSRGADSLVDWISATTSEGDDDIEDGRDPANRSSEDLRKSRMGFLQGHSSGDSFNESEFFSEQVQALNSSTPAPPANFKLKDDHLSGSSMKAPRSFFSLSSFRSKGSDSKPR